MEDYQEKMCERFLTLPSAKRVGAAKIASPIPEAIENNIFILTDCKLMK